MEQDDEFAIEKNRMIYEIYYIQRQEQIVKIDNLLIRFYTDLSRGCLSAR